MPSLFLSGWGRWNSPYINHFLQADTVVSHPFDPQYLNRYSFVLNNPLRYTDPTGHMPCGDGEEHDCDGHKQDPEQNPHPPKPPEPPKPPQDPDKDEDDILDPNKDDATLPLPTTETPSEEPSSCPSCVITGGAVIIAAGALELVFGAAAVGTVILSGPAAIAPIALVFLPIEAMLVNITLIGIEEIVQGEHRAPEDVHIDYLPLVHLVTNPDEGEYFK